MNKIKVSFDFDGTLSRADVQDYARKLISDGVEVWICTARLSNDDAPSKRWNDDLFEVSDQLGIQRTHIKFCSMSDKYRFFRNEDFVLHLDDDMTEIKKINEFTTTLGVNLFGNKQWVHECDEILARALYRIRP